MKLGLNLILYGGRFLEFYLFARIGGDVERVDVVLDEPEARLTCGVMVC